MGSLHTTWGVCPLCPEEHQSDTSSSKLKHCALANIVAEAISAYSDASFEKYPKGGCILSWVLGYPRWLRSNRGKFDCIFLLDFEVIARLPFPIARLPYLTATSEFGTMKGILCHHPEKIASLRRTAEDSIAVNLAGLIHRSLVSENIASLGRINRECSTQYGLGTWRCGPSGIGGSVLF
jgi:hypothetical protein